MSLSPVQEALIAKVDTYKAKHGVSSEKALKALKISPSRYSYAVSKRNKMNKAAEGKNYARMVTETAAPQRLVMITGTPEQIRELLKGDVL